MGCRDNTSMGGSDQAFHTTHWTEILSARTANEEHRRQALDTIFSRYWKPIYCYIRHRGWDNEDAKDLTQGFLEEVFLGRDLVQRADPAKGKFRTFLLTALQRYIASAVRKEKAKKRSPGNGLVSLDGTDVPNPMEPWPGTTPEQAFDRAWASALLDKVLDDLEGRCAADGKETHWAVFSARVLQPIMEGIEPPSLSELCSVHDIPNEEQASNMIVTVKRRFRACLEQHVRQDVNSDAAVGEEIGDLVAVLSGSSAGP